MAAVNISKQVTSYTSDFAGTYNRIPFKIKEGYENRPEVSAYYEDRVSNICGPGNLFKLRQLEVTFVTDTGELDTVLFPIPTQNDVAVAAAAFLQADDVACINYLGERWVRIPSTLVGDVGFNPSATIAATPGGSRLTGTLDYFTDILVRPSRAIPALASIELEPDDVFQGLLSCMDGVFTATGFCNEAANLFTRRLIFKARRSQRPGQFVVRSVPLSDEGRIIPCIEANAPRFVCVGYEGERRLNLQNVLPRT